MIHLYYKHWLLRDTTSTLSSLSAGWIRNQSETVIVDTKEIMKKTCSTSIQLLYEFDEKDQHADVVSYSSADDSQPEND